MDLTPLGYRIAETTEDREQNFASNELDCLTVSLKIQLVVAVLLVANV